MSDCGFEASSLINKVSELTPYELAFTCALTVNVSVRVLDCSSDEILKTKTHDDCCLCPGVPLSCPSPFSLPPFLMSLSSLSCRSQRCVSDDERDGRQCHRWDLEVVLQRAAGATLH